MPHFKTTLILILGLFAAGIHSMKFAGYLKKWKKLNPFGADFQPKYQQLPATLGPSIWRVHTDLDDELREMGAGKRMSEKIKNSWLIHDLCRVFLFTRSLSDAYPRSPAYMHEVDFRIYELLLSTQRLLDYSWKETMFYRSRYYLVYNYESEAFADFQAKVSNTIIAVHNTASQHPEEPTLRDIQEGLELVNLMLSKTFSQLDGFVRENTCFYEVGDSSLPDQSICRPYRDVETAYRFAFNTIHRRTVWRVSLHDKVFWPVVVNMLKGIKQNILATTYSVYNEDAIEVTRALHEFFGSGFVEKSILFADFDAFDLHKYQRLLKVLHNIADLLKLRPSAGMTDSYTQFYKPLIADCTTLEGYLKKVFVSYQAKWVVYASSVKQRLPDPMPAQTTYVKALQEEMGDMESPFLQMHPSVIVSILKTIMSEQSNLLEHVVQPEETTATLQNFYQVSRKFASTGVRHNFVNSQGTEGVGAIEFNLDDCRKLRDILDNSITSPLLASLVAGEEGEYIGQRQVIIARVGDLKVEVKGHLWMTDYICLELLDSTFGKEDLENERKMFNLLNDLRKQETEKQKDPVQPLATDALEEDQEEEGSPMLDNLEKDKIRRVKEEGHKDEDDNLDDDKEEGKKPNAHKKDPTKDENGSRPVPEQEGKDATDKKPQLNGGQVPPEDKKIEPKLGDEDAETNPDASDRNIAVADIREGVRTRPKKITRVFLIEELRCRKCVKDQHMATFIKEHAK